MKRQHVMGRPEGGAVRVQLDAMLAALRDYDRPAAEAGDDAVIRLLHSLYTAAQAAGEIERRDAPKPQYQGVIMGRL